MNIDLGSFAFGNSIVIGGGTPSWGTALGESHPDYRITYPGAESIVVSMVYNSVPLASVTLPLGKGGRLYKASDTDQCQIAALYRKVYVNNKRVNYPFIIVLIKEQSASHYGRRSIKYSDKNEYLYNREHFENKEFVKRAREVLLMGDNACWFVYAMEVKNQDELHLYAVIVDSTNNCVYENSSERKKKWLELIPETKDFKDIVLHRYLSCEKEEDYLQVMYYGAPGTGKSNTIKKKVDEKGKLNFRTTFHPDSDYSTFVGCYKPIMKQSTITKDGVTSTEEKIVYRFEPQSFTNAYITAWNTTEEVYLIIEEINRGNCAQIFGDLFQLLDRKNGVSEYPVDADTSLSNYLKEKLAESNRPDIPPEVKSGKKLVLPSNLYIWATMNTSDQSLFPIDSAFKRRWDWKYMKIRNEHKEWKVDIELKAKDSNSTQKLDWWEFIDKINVIIAAMTLSADKQLGYFFCKATEKKEETDSEPTIITKETFVSKVLFYLWNDVFKDYGFEDASLFTFTEKNGSNEVTKNLTFPEFYEDDGEHVNTARVTDFVEKVMNWKKKEGDNN